MRNESPTRLRRLLAVPTKAHDIVAYSQRVAALLDQIQSRPVCNADLQAGPDRGQLGRTGRDIDGDPNLVDDHAIRPVPAAPVCFFVQSPLQLYVALLAK